MSPRARAAMPAVADVRGSGLSVVDVVTDDAPSVPPVPAGRLDVEHATALTERIRLTAQTTRERLQRLAELVEQAKAGEVADVLGYASWTAYLADVLGGQMRLDGTDRRELVGYLTQQGMSTRAIAPIVGASPKTVARDAAEARVSGDTPAPVTGRDGKTYTMDYRCAECGDLGHGSARNLLRHIKLVHTGPREAAVRAKCDNCGWTTTDPDAMPAHRAMHREAGYQVAADLIRQTAAERWPAEQPALDGMPEPVAVVEPLEQPGAPWLVITRTVAMAKGTQRVFQCADCGTVVVMATLVTAHGSDRPDACPACGCRTWWEQRFPVAGIDLAASA